MEQIELERLKLLAQKARLLTELDLTDKAIERLTAFAQGYAAGQPQPEPTPTEE